MTDDAKSEKPNEGSKKDDVLDTARKRYEIAVSTSSDNRIAALDDLKFLSGEHWPTAQRMNRQIEGRPCLTINTLPAMLHQVTNDQRQNKIAIKVHPVDDGADEETAEIFQGMIRHIEYSSNADVCYDTAVNHAAAVGFGYFRWIPCYESEESFDQVIRFERIRDPLSVKIDPLSKEPDGSDMQWCFIDTRMDRKEFEREFPNAEASNWPLAQKMNLAGWWDADSVVVAEYYAIEYTEATLCLYSDGSTGYKGDKNVQIPPGVTVKKERKTKRPRVMWRKVTGADVLEETEILCKWIPVFPVYGDEIDIEGKVIRSGLVRNAKDPAMMYDFWMTSATEEVALRPKTPFIGAVGQFETARQDWVQANNRSFAFIEYDPVTVDGSIAPAPQRQPMADVPSGMLSMAMHASDNTKRTTGLFDSSLGAQGNATSGKQEIAQQRQGDTANFHYHDGLVRTIRQCGRTLVYSIPKYYDAERVARTLGEDGKVNYVRINQPNTEGKKNKDGKILEILNNISAGTYDVTIGSGPSYDTARQEAVQMMAENMQRNPVLWNVIGDLFVRAQDWVGAEEMADRLKRTIPPQILGSDAEDDEPMIETPKGPLPASQAGAAIGQMDQVIHQLEAKLQEVDELKTKTEYTKQETAKIQAKTAQVQAEAAMIKANADNLRAQFETGQIHGQVAGAIQADTLRTLLGMPIDRLMGLIDGDEINGQEPPGPEEMPPPEMAASEQI